MSPAGPVREENVLSGNQPPASGKRRQWSQLAQSTRVADLACVLLMATGLFSALCTVTAFPGGIPRCLGLCAAALLLVSVLSLRWWIAPVLLVAGGAVAALVALFSQASIDWAGILRWILAGAPAHSMPEEPWLLALECLLALATTLGINLLVRRVYSLPLLLAVSVACLVAIAVTGQQDLSVAVCFTTAGFIVLLPRTYAGLCGVSDRRARAAMQTAALPGALVALVLGLLLIPGDTSGWQSRNLRNLATDVGMLLEGPFSRGPGGASNFSLEGVGFQPGGDRLGGPASPQDIPVLIVDSPVPVLLRGAVRDQYTGDRWTLSAYDGDFRFQSLFWRRYRRQAFDRDRGDSAKARPLQTRLQRDVTVELVYLTNRYSTLFAPGQVEGVAFPQRKLDEEAWFNMRGELYLHARIPNRSRVQIDATVWNFSSPSFEADFLALEQLALEGEDPRFEEIHARYTQLPEALPPMVGETAATITAGHGSPYEKARAIQDWLAENCTYTLTPEMPPEDSDFVAHFLETREGYCTYYASAMAVLARCAGLPARYVSGFGLTTHPDNDRLYLATEASAHAWAEVYFQGIGWMEFDPLAWSAEDPLHQEEPPEPEEPPDDTPPDSLNPPDAPEDSAGEGLGEAATVGRVLLPVMLISLTAGLLVLLAALLLLRWIMGRKTRLYRLDRVVKRYPHPQDALLYYCDDISRQLALLGLSPQPGETTSVYSIRVDRFLPLDGVSFQTICQAKARLVYGDIAPTVQEVEACGGYHQLAEQTLRNRLGRFGYLFRRALKPVRARNPGEKGVD